MKRIWLTVRMSIWGLGLFSGDLFASETVSEAKQLVDSYLHGESTSYRSKGEVKAKGLDIEFQVPKAWKREQSQNGNTDPSITEMFGFDSDASAPRCLLQIIKISDFPPEVLSKSGLSSINWKKVSPREEEILANEFFSDARMRDIYQNSPYLSQFVFSNTRTKVDGWPGTIAMGRVDDSYILGINVLYKEYLIVINISVPKYPFESEVTLRQRFDIYKRLINQMETSIIIHNQRTSIKPSTITPPQKQPDRVPSEQISSSPSFGVVIVKKIDLDVYLCKRNGTLLVVDFSEHPQYNGRALQKGNLVMGTTIPKQEKTKQTMINGKIETLPFVKLIEGNGK